MFIIMGYGEQSCIHGRWCERKMKKRNPYWIKHTHLYDQEDYECSVCHRRYRNAAPSCPACGAKLSAVKDDLGWIDEAEELDIILGDD